MNVIVKNEIITFKQDGIDVEKNPGARVSPEQFEQWLTENPNDVVVLDTRNEFEVGFGKFKGAKSFGLTSFTEFAKAAETFPEEWKNKKVVTYCTGGIRCEKAVPFLNQLGFNDAYQLDGGILNYFAQVGGEHWEGECFVFDYRVAVDVNLEETDSSFCCRCQAPIYDPNVKLSFSESERFCPKCQDTIPQHLKPRWLEFNKRIKS
jgi:UPF0176 protein